MLALHERLASPRAQSGVAFQPIGWTPGPARSSAHFRAGASAPLRALAGDALAARFRSWRGASDRRYIFSIFDRQSRPAYEHVVAIIAARDADGERRLMFVGDTGCFPELTLAKAASEIPAASEIEFHFHLLATSRAERAAMIADLAQAGRS